MPVRLRTRFQPQERDGFTHIQPNFYADDELHERDYCSGNHSPFTPGSLSQVLAQREGKPFILVLWSLECQYCPTELKTLSELKRSHPKLDVVLIATDEVSDTPQLLSRTQSYGIANAEQWVFAEDMPERFPLEIDERWYGEVPRTYFYDRKHQREVKTGLVSKKFFEDWLARNAVPRAEN